MRLAELVTMHEAASQAGKPYRTFFRVLTSLHRSHGGEWLLRLGRRKYLVNLSGLRAAHPALFEARFVSREEMDAMGERLGYLEHREHEQNRKINAQGARLRALEGARSGTVLPPS